MQRIIHIFLIISVYLLTLSCTKDHHIVIENFFYSDSVTHQDPHSKNVFDLRSEVRLSMLRSTSDDEREQKIVKNINNFIKDQVSEGFKTTDGDSLVREISHSYVMELLDIARSRYSSSDEESSDLLSGYDDTELYCTFYNNVDSECHFGLGDTIICFTGNTSCYMGGAHPGEESFAYSFSLNDGNIVRPNKLLKKNCKSEMIQRIKQKLIKQNKVKNEEELQGLGFKDIFISPNILLEKDSILFHYKNYTIAPFYLGSIDIKFGYDELSDITTLSTD